MLQFGWGSKRFDDWGRGRVKVLVGVNFVGVGQYPITSYVKNMGWSRISSIDMVAGKVLLVNCSQAWDLFRENWWDLITFESILFVYSFFVCQFLKYLVHPSNRRDQLGVWEVAFFSLAEEIVFSFFYFLFDIFWNSINVAYVSQLGEEDLIYDYLFTSQCSLILFQIKIFLLYLRLFLPIWSFWE